jgi:hypothetical protein
MGGIDPTIPPLSGRRAQAALADHGDPGAAFAGFLARVVDADTHAFTLRLAGTFPPTPDLYHDAERAQALTAALLQRAKAAGAVRADLDANDLAFVFEQLASVRLGDPGRTRQLRHRYLGLLLDALRSPTPAPLPGPPPTWADVSGRWDHPANR